MKNIHILPTDKLSRLFEIDNHLIINREQLIQPKYYRNIYITSDEEIKEGDWSLDIIHNTISKRSDDRYKKQYKKIILTTDQDLINDGIQAIDDEFLEWFIKNPSCEYVDLIGLRKEKGYEFLGYEIIIPKEEPKQDWYCPKCQSYVSSENVTFEETHQICNTSVIIQESNQETPGYICPQTKKQCDDECCVSAEDCHIKAGIGIQFDCEQPKQETLEKAIAKGFIKTSKEIDYTEFDWTSFKLGAKWQAERMYSEEEVMDMFHNFSMHLPLHYEFLVKEQFKKK